jgi:hypothetical protein
VKRTPIKRSAWPLTNGAKPKARSKRLASRRTATSAVRQSARGEACTLGFPCCNGDRATTVWCHSNRLEDGKGMGLKARDEEGCYGCSTCHAFLDGGYAAAGWERSVVDLYFDRARTISQQLLRQKGLL